MTNPQIAIIEPDIGINWVRIRQYHEGEYQQINLDTDTGLELANLLMSICKGQGSGMTHTLPKDKGK